MNGFKLHKDGAVTTKKKKIPTVNKWVCTICGKEGYGLPHHECFTFEDKILSRLSSLEESVKEIERDVMYLLNERIIDSVEKDEPKQEWCTCKKPDPIRYDGDTKDTCVECGKFIQPKEDDKKLREKIIQVICHGKCFSGYKTDAKLLTERILAIVKGEV